jgi:hypothetical protein
MPKTKIVSQNWAILFPKIAGREDYRTVTLFSLFAPSRIGVELNFPSISASPLRGNPEKFLI